MPFGAYKRLRMNIFRNISVKRLLKYGRILFILFAVAVIGIDCCKAGVSAAETGAVSTEKHTLGADSDNRTAWEISDETTSATLVDAVFRAKTSTTLTSARKYTQRSGNFSDKNSEDVPHFGRKPADNVLFISRNFGRIKEYYVFFLRRLLI